MATSTTSAAASAMSLLPISQLKKQQRHAAGSVVVFARRPKDARPRRYVVPTARLFGPAIFEASKLRVLFLGVDEEKHPGKLPRTYTLTHSDVTAKLTLAVSRTINRAQLQGWYNKLQRDEVVAEWKKVQGRMSLHVHCHISGGHFLLDLIAGLRYYIFRKELPVVLKAFVHGDGNLFSRHPELEEATVWVYFHSNLPRFNRVESWGPLHDAAAPPRRPPPPPPPPTRRSRCPCASGRSGAPISATAASRPTASSSGRTSTTWRPPTPPPPARRSSDRRRHAATWFVD